MRVYKHQFTTCTFINSKGYSNAIYRKYTLYISSPFIIFLHYVTTLKDINHFNSYKDTLAALLVLLGCRTPEEIHSATSLHSNIILYNPFSTKHFESRFGAGAFARTSSLRFDSQRTGSRPGELVWFQSGTNSFTHFPPKMKVKNN